MGAFNEWTKNSRLESWENRYVADIGEALLEGAAYLYRLNCMGIEGITFDPNLKRVIVK